MAKGPGGIEIGRLNIKVLPDTSDFRREIRGDIEQVESYSKAHRSGYYVKLTATLDTDGLKRSVLENIKAINAENKVMGSRKIRIYTDVSATGVDNSLSEAIKSIQSKVADRKIKLKTHFAVATADLELDKDSLKDVKRQLDHWRKQNDPIKLQVKPDFGTVAAKVVKVKMDFLARDRIVNLIPKLDSKATVAVGTALAALSGARVLSKYFENLWDSIKNLDKAAPVISTVATAVAGLAAWGLSAVSNLFSLGASLASIIPAALALPGIVGGLAIGVGSAVAVFKDFNKVLPEVKTQLSGVQKEMSKDFWTQAKKPIKDFIDTLLPSFLSGLKSTATELGGFFGELATELKGTLNPLMSSMFKNLADSINIASTGTQGIAQSIASLGSVGASYLPRLAQWFTTLSNNLGAFLTKAANDGSLKKWVDTGVEALKELGNVISGVFDVLSGLGRAALQAGGTTLASLGQALHTIADVINTPVFQQTLVGVLEGAHTALSEIAKTAGPAVTKFFQTLGGVLMQILPSVGTAIGTLLRDIATALSNPALVQALNGLFQDIAAAITSLTPLWGPLSDAIAQLGPVLGALVKNLAPLLVSLAQPLADIFTTLSPIVVQLVQTLGGGLLAVLQSLAPVVVDVIKSLGGFLSNGLLPAIGSLLADLAPVVEEVGTALSEFLRDGLKAIAPLLPTVAKLFGELVKSLAPIAATLLHALGPILPVIAEAFGQILTAVTPLIAPLANLLTAILVPLAPVIAQLATSIIPLLTGALVEIVPSLVQLVDMFTQLVNLLMPVLIPALGFLAQMLTSTVEMAINGVTNIINGALLVIQGVWEIIHGIFTGDWSQLWQGVKDVFEGIWKGIVGYIEVALTTSIFGAFTKFGGLFKAGWEALWGAVKGAAELLWQALKDDFGAWLSLFKDMPKESLGLLKDLFSSVWSDIVATAQALWGDIVSAFSTGTVNLLKFVKGIPGDVVAAFGDAGKILLKVGEKIIGGLIDGFKNKVGDVKNWLGGLTSKLVSWKGPPKRDAKLLTGAGQLIIEGLIEGFESRYDAVRKSLQGFTDNLSGIGFDVSLGMAGTVSGAIDNGGNASGKTFIYNAAPNNSLDSEEDLFNAVGRARFIGW